MQWSRQNNTNGQIIISDIDCWSLTMDKNGSLYVSDCKKNEVRRWKRGEKNGTRVASGYGKGDHFNPLNEPNYIFVDEDYSLYIYIRLGQSSCDEMDKRCQRRNNCSWWKWQKK
jgi:hypothetical protein